MHQYPDNAIKIQDECTSCGTTVSKLIVLNAPDRIEICPQCEDG